MVSLQDAIKSASKHAKPASIENSRAGAVASLESPVEMPLFHHRDDDSPTSMFTSENIELGAINSMQRLMNSWDSRIQELEREFLAPIDYIGEANRLFAQYQGLRLKLDSSVAYSVGDTLNRCRARFFSAGSLDGKTWTEFLKTECRFSFRLGYDFINIASRLGELKGRMFSMDQLRAILQLQGVGYSVAALPPNAEQLSVKELLDLVERDKKKEGVSVSTTISCVLTKMGPLAVKMDTFATELQEIMSRMETAGTELTIGAKEQRQIAAAKVKLQDMLATLDILTSTVRQV